MNRNICLRVLFIISSFLFGCSSPGTKNNNFVLIKTSSGEVKIKLYDQTPVHRDNFLKLVKMGFYEGVSFHRVIRGFMIQAGDGLTRKAGAAAFNDTLNTYSIPAEFNPLLFHKKGALAAAREGNDINPDMRSSGTQFYIVQGKTLTEEELNIVERKINNNIKQAMFLKILREVSDSSRKSGLNLTEAEIQERVALRLFYLEEKSGDYKISSEQRNEYMKSGGTPGLDATYTVFGEVVEGLEIVDRIAAVKTDINDKPENDIRILKMKIVRR